MLFLEISFVSAKIISSALTFLIKLILVSIDKDFAEAQCELAISLMKKNELDEARIHFLNSLEINPNYADAYYYYGLLLVKLAAPKIDDTPAK